MELHNIYGLHAARITEDQAAIIQNLEVTASLFNYKINKGWSSGYGSLHKNVKLKEIISFYMYNTENEPYNFSTEKYNLEIGLDRNKNVIDTRLIRETGRDRDFETILLAQGLQESLDKLIEEITKSN